jgi:adenosyl cobinamide kinase/adenosyl cobinamide phosphate guanylyltransferase
METNFNPYARKVHTNDYGVYFNLLYYYCDKYAAQPFIHEVNFSINESSIKKIEKMGAKRIFSCENEKFIDEERSVNNTEVCFEFEDVLCFFYRRESIVSRFVMEYEDGVEDEEEDLKEASAYRCKILFQKKENMEKVRSCIERDPEPKKHSNVYLLCSSDGMLALQRFDIKLPQKKIDLKLNYGEAASEKFDKVIKCLSKNKNGLVLFSGDPGTGKSTFIKYLTTKTTRKVIYISSAAAEQLTNPDFLSFIMRHRNAVLLLEDAEKVLRSRESQDNEAISNILNITDGILGDCLNIMVVATFNIDRENIDKALVRKGRLLVEHHFSPLKSEEANLVLKSLGSSRKAESPMTLAEIYNEDENFHEKEEKRKVGF